MEPFSKYLTQATAIVGAVVGQIVAYVPSFAPGDAHVISVGSFALAIGLLAHDGLKERTVYQVQGEAKTVVKAGKREIQDAVHLEVATILSGMVAPPTPAPAPLSAPVAPPELHPLP
jgi:hypothetical protein